MTFKTMTTHKYSNLFQQRSRRKDVSISIRFEDDCIFICSENASKSLLTKLKNEIVYDGYVETGEVDHGVIRLSNPDLWNCTVDELKDIIISKLEDENYKVTFLP